MSVLLRLIGGVSAHNITDAGNISTSTVFGSLTLSVNIGASGLETTTVFGAPSVSVTVAPAGLETTTAFGSPALSAQIDAIGLVTSTVFGLPTVSTPSGATGNLVCLSDGSIALKISGRIHVLMKAPALTPDETIKGKPLVVKSRTTTVI